MFPALLLLVAGSLPGVLLLLLEGGPWALHAWLQTPHADLLLLVILLQLLLPLLQYSAVLLVL